MFAIRQGEWKLALAKGSGDFSNSEAGPRSRRPAVEPRERSRRDGSSLRQAPEYRESPLRAAGQISAAGTQSADVTRRSFLASGPQRWRLSWRKVLMSSLFWRRILARGISPATERKISTRHTSTASLNRACASLVYASSPVLR